MEKFTAKADPFNRDQNATQSTDRRLANSADYPMQPMPSDRRAVPTHRQRPSLTEKSHPSNFVLHGLLKFLIIRLRYYFEVLRSTFRKTKHITLRTRITTATFTATIFIILKSDHPNPLRMKSSQTSWHFQNRSSLLFYSPAWNSESCFWSFASATVNG
jgi:hypothetical protein